MAEIEQDEEEEEEEVVVAETEEEEEYYSVLSRVDTPASCHQPNAPTTNSPAAAPIIISSDEEENDAKLEKCKSVFFHEPRHLQVIENLVSFC